MTSTASAFAPETGTRPAIADQAIAGHAVTPAAIGDGVPTPPTSDSSDADTREKKQLLSPERQSLPAAEPRPAVEAHGGTVQEPAARRKATSHRTAAPPQEPVNLEALVGDAKRSGTYDHEDHKAGVRMKRRQQAPREGVMKRPASKAAVAVLKRPGAAAVSKQPGAAAVLKRPGAARPEASPSASAAEDDDGDDCVFVSETKGEEFHPEHQDLLVKAAALCTASSLPRREVKMVPSVQKNTLLFLFSDKLTKTNFTCLSSKPFLDKGLRVMHARTAAWVVKRLIAAGASPSDIANVKTSAVIFDVVCGKIRGPLPESWNP